MRLGFSLFFWLKDDVKADVAPVCELSKKITWSFILMFKDSLIGSYPVTGRVGKSMEVSIVESGRHDEDAIWDEVNQEAEELFRSTIRASHRYTRKANVGMLAIISSFFFLFR